MCFPTGQIYDKKKFNYKPLNKLKMSLGDIDFKI